MISLVILAIIAVSIMFLLPIAVIVIIIVNASKKKNNDKNYCEYPANAEYQQLQYANYSNNQNFPYQAVNLLTEREYGFFKVLKVIADRNNLDVLMKIRLADLVKVKDSIPRSEFYRHFNRISAKHIDFALADESRVVALIELDDSTHIRNDRTERDKFINETVMRCGYRLIRTYGDTREIEDAVMQYRKNIRA